MHCNQANNIYFITLLYSGPWHTILLDTLWYTSLVPLTLAPLLTLRALYQLQDYTVSFHKWEKPTIFPYEQSCEQCSIERQRPESLQPQQPLTHICKATFAVCPKEKCLSRDRPQNHTIGVCTFKVRRTGHVFIKFACLSVWCGRLAIVVLLGPRTKHTIPSHRARPYLNMRCRFPQSIHWAKWVDNASSGCQLPRRWETRWSLHASTKNRTPACLLVEGWTSHNLQ